MFRQKNSSSLLALIMLVVFALSITPQKFIHDLVANHVDPPKCLVHKDLPIEQIENTSLHCTIDFQVATTPFVVYDFSIEVPSPLLARAKNVLYLGARITPLSIVSDTRGPPAC
jgi:hypothetical protein